MNHNFDWVHDDELSEGSDSDYSDGSYHPLDSDTDKMDVKSDSDNQTSTELSQKVQKVLHYMNLLGISLPLFLDALSWGDKGCVQDEQVKSAWTALMGSPKLPGILKHWWKPPHTSTRSHKARAAGARTVMNNFVTFCINETVTREMEAIVNVLHSSGGVTEKDFTDVKFDKIMEEVKHEAPNLWSLLWSAAYTPKQEKTKQKSILTRCIIAILIKYIC
jgi:hypothetical protein